MAVKIALIVDDDVALCELFSYAFRNTGYQTYTANDVDTAFDLLQHKPIDILLLDNSLPATTGHAMVCQIRALPEYRHLRIIMVTSYEEVEHDPIIQAHTDLVLLKPVRISELVNIANHLLTKTSDAEL